MHFLSLLIFKSFLALKSLINLIARDSTSSNSVMKMLSKCNYGQG